MKVRNWVLAMVSMVVLWGSVMPATAQDRRDDRRDDRRNDRRQVVRRHHRPHRRHPHDGRRY